MNAVNLVTVIDVIGHLPPPNDDFDNATVMSGLPFGEGGSLVFHLQ